MNLAEQFWRTVGEELDPRKVKVGDAIAVERDEGKVRLHAIVEAVWDDPDTGDRKIKIRDPLPGETPGAIVATIIEKT